MGPAARVLKEVHLNYDPKAKLDTLSVSQMQLVESAKAVSVRRQPTEGADQPLAGQRPGRVHHG
ncbi:hypothetical protein [Lawsonibacter sp. JLR.KK007]|uniref:hypothetical protein n=1 Tax=Lawsonibacter sp. JLR.KK007 TaxID=3114293 RepID=UPI003FA53B4E